MNPRMERIERILKELRYEIEIGMIQGEIDESIGYQFYVPISKSIPDGVVFCDFRTRPLPRYSMFLEDMEPRLKLIKR
jgi:hypothetical protein